MYLTSRGRCSHFRRINLIFLLLSSFLLSGCEGDDGWEDDIYGAFSTLDPLTMDEIDWILQDYAAVSGTGKKYHD